MKLEKIISIMIIVLVVTSIFKIIFYFKNNVGASLKAKKDQKTIWKEAVKTLSHNAKDPNSLMIVANMYYTEKNYEKAMQTYKVLLDLSIVRSNIDKALVSLRCGMCAYHLDFFEVAYNLLLGAWEANKNNYELNSTLGKLEFKLGQYKKAVESLKRCLEEDSTDNELEEYLGLSLFKLKDYRLAYSRLEKIPIVNFKDSETTFSFATCCQHLNKIDRAQNLFRDLKDDPIWGSQSCLSSGSISEYMKNYDAAITDFEDGLKNENIPLDIKVQLHYRLAMSFAKLGKHEEAISNLKKVESLSPNYKNVLDLLGKFKEFYVNKNLGIYLHSKIPVFVNLCINMIGPMFPKTSISIANIQKTSEFVEIVADVSSHKWDETVLLKFMRQETPIGDLIIKELYDRLKDTRASRGVCFNIGGFSDSAKDFVKARIIDLVDKPKLIKYLNLVH